MMIKGKREIDWVMNDLINFLLKGKPRKLTNVDDLMAIKNVVAAILKA